MWIHENGLPLPRESMQARVPEMICAGQNEDEFIMASPKVGVGMVLAVGAITAGVEFRRPIGRAG